MKKLEKLNLHQLNQVEMNDRTMNMVRGGNTCGCGCNTVSKAENYEANWDKNLYSPGGSIICSWDGSGDVSIYSSNKKPGMP